MRFSLQDVRKSVQRRGSELSVSLHFLGSGELHAEVVRLIAYYESLLGQPQRSFSFDDARACIGEYRMANCLIATLSNWYRWQPPDWTTTLSAIGANAELMALTSPVQLRLALYNYVNAHFHGFLSVQHRSEALQAFAAQFQLTSSDLEYLLLLDSEEEAVLMREALQPPDVHMVATLYNQWVFESALFNASSVRFVIDCAAFSAAQRDPAVSDVSAASHVASVTTTGVGSVIKRLCYLARRLGVYYDLEYLSPAQTAINEPEPGQPLLLTLTLYGPQDVTGAPQQYGLRLARLCRILLGYGIAKPSMAQPARHSPRKSQLATSIVHAEARIHFLQNAYNFVMTANLPALLAPTTLQEQEKPVPVHSEQAELFDSSIEQSFAEAFISLANSQGADGWHLEREPEPLLLVMVSLFLILPLPVAIHVSIWRSLASGLLLTVNARCSGCYSYRIAMISCWLFLSMPMRLLPTFPHIFRSWFIMISFRQLMCYRYYANTMMTSRSVWKVWILLLCAKK